MTERYDPRVHEDDWSNLDPSEGVDEPIEAASRDFRTPGMTPISLYLQIGDRAVRNLSYVSEDTPPEIVARVLHQMVDEVLP